MVLIKASCTMLRTSIHRSSDPLSDLISRIYLSLPLYNWKGFKWSSGFPYFVQFKSKFAIRKSDAGLKYVREKPHACHFCCKYFPNAHVLLLPENEEEIWCFQKNQYTGVFIGRRKRFLLISEDKRLCWDKLWKKKPGYHVAKWKKNRREGEWRDGRRQNPLGGSHQWAAVHGVAKIQTGLSN